MLSINFGCGHYHLAGWTNVDADPACGPDICANVPPMPQFGSDTADEIYAGHFLEHLAPEDAERFLQECYRILKPGGRLGIVIPDAAEIFRRWLAGAVDEVEYPEGTWWPIKDLESVNRLFVYSTVQETSHRWLWDVYSLGRAMNRAGFGDLRQINRFRDPRLGAPAWYQDGLDGNKPQEAHSGAPN